MEKKYRSIVDGGIETKTKRMRLLRGLKAMEGK